ncbi:hypothetical protein AB0425_23925 [Actinosynnema sp. NPDC051121]
MTDEQFEDLKQLIEARASATEKYLEQRMVTKGDLEEVRAEVKGLEERIGAKVDTVLDAVW